DYLIPHHVAPASWSREYRHIGDILHPIRSRSTKNMVQYEPISGSRAIWAGCGRRAGGDPEGPG
ncbi:hypothetical protein LXJ58_33790, partial [Escherichia coli]|nr:hypothetical protein [Escherichia coli]